MQAAYNFGVRYLVSDTSRPGQGNPSPNAGIYNALVPPILMIPRYPTELFEGVTTPEQWTDFYNQLYGAYWGRDLSYEEILNDQSDRLLGYLLRGDTNPMMFHQGNLRAYDGQHSLLGDLLDLTLAKYNQVFTLPIKCPTMDVLGVTVADRMAYNASGVTGVLAPGVSVTLRTVKTAKIPLTGARYGTSTESYGGQWTSFVTVTGGRSVIISLK
jgi:hypothetical protein